MKKTCGLLVALLLLPAAYAERKADRALEEVIQQFGRSLQYQTANSDWRVLRNSPEEGFSAGTVSSTGPGLLVSCVPDEFYGAFLVWPTSDSLGTDYDDGDNQPVTLNWRNPDLTQSQQWLHLSPSDEDFDQVLIVNQLNGRPVSPQETDSFLDRLTRHAELNAVVTVSSSGSTKQATFTLDGAPSAETVKACGQEQTSSETTLYFPDYVDGAGWSVQLVLSNIGIADEDATVVVEVFDQAGQPVRDLFVSSGTVTIPSLGNRVLRSGGTGEVRRGWIQVRTDTDSVSGMLTYSHIQTGIEVGVEPVELGSHFALFVEESSDIGTGLAIFKPDASPRIELRIRDEAGNDPLDGVFVPHGDFHQRARTMAEWFGVEGVDTGFLRDFRGLLFLRTEDGSLFAPLGLRFGRPTGSLSAVPVIRGGDVSGGMPPSGTGGAPPTVSLSASPTSVERGQSATLRWSSTNATSASITPGIGTVPTSGSRRVSPTRTTSYRITVRSADGQTASASATVTVTEPPPPPSLAPADQDAFNDVFVGKRALTDDPNDYIDFISPGRFTEGSDEYPGSYTYGNTGSNTGTLTLNYDDGDRCTSRLTFASATSGRATFSCNDGTSGSASWRLVEIPASGTPDLVIQTPSVSDSSPNAGGSFTFSATVRNQGNGLSASTTLRYYRSPDATISASDTAVGTDAVKALVASGSSAQSVALTAPSAAGTYYYGACVDPVSGESNSQNNCSTAVRVTVSASQIESAGFDLAAINRYSPEGIVFANDRFFVVDGRPWVYAYTASGQHDAASGFALDSANFNATGITFANDRFFVVDRGGDKVYAYQSSGQRDAASDFALDSDNWDATGITFANDRFFVADWPGNKVYAYQSSGQRDAASDFALDSDNMTANGITFANNRFFVADLVGNKVYAYQSSGQRDAASDFALDSGNWGAAGITFANDRFFVVDADRDKVYAYSAGAGPGTGGNPGSGSEDEYVRHESLTIGRGWVQYLNFQTGVGSCIDLTGSTVNANGVRYMLVSSKWQTRANSSDAWADIPGTSESGRLCAYDPVDPGEYRFVAEISIDGVVGKYSSNILGEGFDLASANSLASGITYANGKFYVASFSGGFNNKVYAYQPSGQRDRASDFDMDDSSYAEGITYANGKFYVVGSYSRDFQKVYAYQPSGPRDSASDFDLDPDNGGATGITFANDRFYVVDRTDVKVYAYHASGPRDSASDFDLDPDNGGATGITFANDRFYVVDRTDVKVYAYHASGPRDSASDFDLDPDNDYAGGITFANDRFYVVDSEGFKVDVYK